MQAENGRTEQSREGQKWLTRLTGVGHFLPLSTVVAMLFNGFRFTVFVMLNSSRDVNVSCAVLSFDPVRRLPFNRHIS